MTKHRLEKHERKNFLKYKKIRKPQQCLRKQQFEKYKFLEIQENKKNSTMLKKAMNKKVVENFSYKKILEKLSKLETFAFNKI